ncbi:11530_t:CDS:2 [Ambispora leptoticha]|uniref:11530_t:CDS:1 n=1 Tax=Ambispora leptoticha TaxID=144679 RepID=A0A9N8V6Z3_9GLOM|nr:11530_t:CDS:2 [Ambispora leptoticha]
MNKEVKEKLLELKKEKLVKTLRKFFVEKKIKRAINNPNSQYRISVIGLGVYFATKSQSSNKSPNPQVQYLPNEEEFQAKVDQLKNEKGIDDQQAAIEVLTAYVPYIN